MVVIALNDCLTLPRWRILGEGKMKMLQVGPGHGYMLTVEGFNRTLSTLGDAMTDIYDGMNGMKFSAK